MSIPLILVFFLFSASIWAQEITEAEHFQETLFICGEQEGVDLSDERQRPTKEEKTAMEVCLEARGVHLPPKYVRTIY